MTRTANLRDLLENLFGCSSPVARGAFFSETSLFLVAEAGITPVGALTSSRIQIFFLQKRHNQLTLTSLMRILRVDISLTSFKIAGGRIGGIKGKGNAIEIILNSSVP